MGMIAICDAHAHRSLVGGGAIDCDSYRFTIEHAVVNGTQPIDWPECNSEQNQKSSIEVRFAGVHPWVVSQVRALPWRERLQELLERGLCGIGEIGLDGVERPGRADLNEQCEVFVWQLRLAAEHNLPVSIHCVRASGLLVEILTKTPQPERGIHLHDFNGSPETLRQIQKQTEAWFSFGPRSLLQGNPERVQDLLSHVSDERLLFETDVPVSDEPVAEAVDWPRALIRMAELRRLSVAALATILNQNYRNYFLSRRCNNQP